MLEIMEQKLVRPRPHIMRAESYCYDRDGKLLWHDPWTENILHDEGEQAILSAFFATAYSGYGAAPATLYIGLDNRVTLAEADTLATVAANGEPTTGGYARKPLSTSGTGVAGQPFVIAQPSTFYQVTASTVTFGPATTGGMGAVRNRFLCTHLSATASAAGQRLIASVPLSTVRTINEGDSLQTNIIIGLSEA